MGGFQFDLWFGLGWVGLVWFDSSYRTYPGLTPPELLGELGGAVGRGRCLGKVRGLCAGLLSRFFVEYILFIPYVPQKMNPSTAVVVSLLSFVVCSLRRRPTLPYPAIPVH